MAKRVFFSFHYQDVVDFRANVVRNHWRLKPDREEAGFFDASLWEEARKRGDVAVKRLINAGIDRTCATCVLIGTHTYARRWVRYEIMKSLKKGNTVIGVHINSVKGRDGAVKPQGKNPFEYLALGFSDSGLTSTLYEWRDSHWQEYDEVDGQSSYQTTPPPLAYRGRTHQLSKLFLAYDWIIDNGYDKFSTWVV